jgi:hypothetical protein
MTGADGNTYFQNAAYNQGASAPGAVSSAASFSTMTGMPGSGAPPATPAYVAPQAPVTPPVQAEFQPVPTFNPADISALLGQMQGMAGAGTGVEVPTYQAGQVDQFAGGASSDALSRALQSLIGAQGLMDPNTAGQKEAAKETLLSQRQQMQDAIRASTAGRGVGATQQAALEAQAGDNFAGALTGTYRDIDSAAQQQSLQNRLNVGGALSSLGQAQGAEGRADYGATLQGQQMQEALRQAETALGLQAGSLTAQLQQQQFGQLANVAALQGSEGRANYASQLAGTGQQNQNALSNAQLLAQQVAQQNQLGLGYAQLEQQAAQMAAQMGYNYANLSQQDKQYFAQLAQQNQQFGQTFGLNSAIAGNNADNNFMQTLLGLFRQ